MKLDPCNYTFETPHSQNSTIQPPPRDIFAEAREKYTIADVWAAFGFAGEPKASCKSPFREDKRPSFSIYNDGKSWTDHTTGESGDVIEFARHALGGCDHKAVREWFRERLGIDHLDHFPVTRKPAKVQETQKCIEWPGELAEGSEATWAGFAELRGLTYPAVWTLVQSGILRFTRIKGGKCYVITDDERRAAEIRRMDGQLFGESKAYPLRGCDKRWLPGASLLRMAAPDTAVLVVEGATDLLAAVDLYARYRRNHGGTQSWQPVTLLGASCRTLHPEAIELIRGRHVRIVPDADDAGDRMRDHWTDLLRRLGCTVDAVTLPRGTDLTDHLSTISPTDLFSK
jgi:5S rRNA maturation endonuclease (ribonuclease M5)